MRQIVQVDADRSRSTNSNTTPAHRVLQVTTLEEFKSAIVPTTATTQPHQLTVVRFYAPWCRACRAVEAAFYRMASSSHDAPAAAQVQFVQVPVQQDNAQLHASLGVTKLPYAHIYHATAGLVEELKMGKRRFADFQRIVQSYQQASCELPVDVDPESGVYEAPYDRVG